jgi:hypothetical protein
LATAGQPRVHGADRQRARPAGTARRRGWDGPAGRAAGRPNGFSRPDSRLLGGLRERLSVCQERLFLVRAGAMTTVGAIGEVRAWPEPAPLLLVVDHQPQVSVSFELPKRLANVCFVLAGGSVREQLVGGRVDPS